MYKIRYDNQSTTCNTADEVIAALSKLHAYYKNIKATLISVQWYSH